MVHLSPLGYHSTPRNFVGCRHNNNNDSNACGPTSLTGTKPSDQTKVPDLLLQETLWPFLICSLVATPPPAAALRRPPSLHHADTARCCAPCHVCRRCQPAMHMTAWPVSLRFPCIMSPCCASPTGCSRLSFPCCSSRQRLVLRRTQSPRQHAILQRHCRLAARRVLSRRGSDSQSGWGSLPGPSRGRRVCTRT